MPSSECFLRYQAILPESIWKIPHEKPAHQVRSGLLIDAPGCAEQASLEILRAGGSPSEVGIIIFVVGV